MDALDRTAPRGRIDRPATCWLAPSRPRVARLLALLLLLAASALPASAAGAAGAAGLADTIERVTPSIVAIGTFAPLRQPASKFYGTGFVVADGRHVLTNRHVLPARLDGQANEVLVVFTEPGRWPGQRRAEVVAKDSDHDLVLLRISGEPLPALRVAGAERVRPGERYVFTGFPLGVVLGLYPVTHAAMVSAITPIAIPQGRARTLDPALIRRLNAPYTVFQLDATAYPGNSGSPLYDPDTGRVVGVINKVFIKETKENILRDPSGITYAIPGQYARALIEEALGP